MLGDFDLDRAKNRGLAGGIFVDFALVAQVGMAQDRGKTAEAM